MKLKILFTVLTAIFIIICMTQIINIYPYADDVFGYYKSGYFNELDTQFNVIADSFIKVKMMSRPDENIKLSVPVRNYTDPVYSWIMLDDIAEKYGIEIKVYDRNGNFIPVPSVKRENDNPAILKLINSVDFDPVSGVDRNYYNYILPVKTEPECLICHKNTSVGQITGIISFRRKFNSYIYYGFERIILFSFLAFLSIILLFFIIKWDPEKNIKELFDKTE
ncbi:MAG: hypothetical protein JW982_14575 [Spirochaetes bacterium]|nr:hypothetical protein [Spirochaetota bacterium]